MRFRLLDPQIFFMMQMRCLFQVSSNAHVQIIKDSHKYATTSQLLLLCSVLCIPVGIIYSFKDRGQCLQYPCTSLGRLVRNRGTLTDSNYWQCLCFDS